MGMNTALLASALEYASRGWAVFPILPVLGQESDQMVGACRHQHSGLRPVDWERWATTDTVRIAKVWERRSWGIGIALGPSNLLVVESELTRDNRMPGEIQLYDLATKHGSLPSTWTVSGPTGTLIRYYQHPDEPIAATKLCSHLQIRARDHYTIAPPSVTSEGIWHLLQNRPVAPLPLWFAQILTQP